MYTVALEWSLMGVSPQHESKLRRGGSGSGAGSGTGTDTDTGGDTDTDASLESLSADEGEEFQHSLSATALSSPGK